MNCHSRRTITRTDRETGKLKGERGRCLWIDFQKMHHLHTYKTRTSVQPPLITSPHASSSELSHYYQSSHWWNAQFKCNFLPDIHLCKTHLSFLCVITVSSAISHLKIAQRQTTDCREWQSHKFGPDLEIVSAPLQKNKQRKHIFNHSWLQRGWAFTGGFWKFSFKCFKLFFLISLSSFTQTCRATVWSG